MSKNQQLKNLRSNFEICTRYLDAYSKIRAIREIDASSGEFTTVGYFLIIRGGNWSVKIHAETKAACYHEAIPQLKKRIKRIIQAYEEHTTTTTEPAA